MRLFWNVFRTGLPWAVGLGVLIALYPQPARTVSAHQATTTTTARPPAKTRATVPARAPRQAVTPVTAPQTTAPRTPGPRITAPQNTPAPGPRVTLSRCDQLKIAWDKIAQRNVDILLKPPYELTPEQEAKESRA